jgi:hypothetical protein
MNVVYLPEAPNGTAITRENIFPNIVMSEEETLDSVVHGRWLNVAANQFEDPD